MFAIRPILPAALILAVLASPVARAEDDVVRSKLPLWRVGNIDQKLSRLCALGKFNQRIPYRFPGHFWGDKGSALIGGVKGTGLNLWDPYKKADPTKDYWFHRDRTAACVVMWAKVKPPGAAEQANAQAPNPPLGKPPGQ